MRSSIHFRGLVVVGLVAVFALLAMGQVLVVDPGCTAGRFTIVTGQPHLDQPVAYVLDTATGQVWASDLDAEAFFAAKIHEVVDPNIVVPLD
jgi:hypothetical protein